MLMKEKILVEHSEPGLVIKPVDSFENVLRHFSYERALELRRQLIEIAQEMGSEYATTLEQFHLEVPGDSTRPPALATLGEVSYEMVKEVTDVATERGLGEFQVGMSILLEGKAQSREDYISDLRFSIETATGYRIPPLPKVIREHRRRLLERRLGARDVWLEDTIGHQWVEEKVRSLRRDLEGIDRDVCAVIAYELERLAPEALSTEELAEWCTAALRLGGERFLELFTALEGKLSYLYQRASFAYRFHEAPGFCPQLVQEHLRKCMAAYLEEAKQIYTAEAVEALEQMRAKMLEDPLAKLREGIKVLRTLAPSSGGTLIRRDPIDKEFHGKGSQKEGRPPLLVDEVLL